MLSRFNWRQRLRQTSASECLRTGTVAQFPLDEILGLTTTFLENSPAGLFEKGVEPFTEQAETILLRELHEVQGQLRHYEVALLATTRGIRRNTLRALMVKLAPLGIPPDELFEDTVAIYLQCIILAHKSAPLLIDDEECRAAEELFALVKAWKRRAWETFPTISTALRVCARQGLDDVIPPSMIRALLLRNGYGKMFQNEVERLQQACKWARLHDLVSSIPRPEDHPRLRDILPLIVLPGQCLGLLTWQPNRARILLWEERLSDGQRAEAIAILRLEGPDDGPQQRRTIRESGPGPFIRFAGLPSHEAEPLLDHLLGAFDRAIMNGPSSLRWLLSECAGQPHSRTPEALRKSLMELDAAMDLGNDDSVGTLSQFVQSLRTDMGIMQRMGAMAAALPYIGASPELRSACGHRHGLERQAPNLLKEAQDHFQGLLDQDLADQAFALQLRSLGHVMFQADWLRFTWPPAFVAMLGKMPSEDDLKRALSIIGGLVPSQQASSRQDLKKFLSARLCGRSVPGFDGSNPVSALLHPSTPSLSPCPSPSPSEQPKPNSWLTKPLEANRALLREKLQRIPEIDPELVATCLQKVKEPAHDNFIKDLNCTLLLSEIPQRNPDAEEEEDEVETCPFTDMVCVNIAKQFAPRVIPRHTRSLQKCWPQVLLHMMRQRPEGMLDRLGGSLSRESWRSWHNNLEILYNKTGHLDEQGAIGFTKQAIDLWTRRLGAIPGRHVSIASLPARLREQANEFSDTGPRASSSSERRVDAMQRRVTSATLRLPRTDRS